MEQNNANSRHNNTRSVWCKEEDLYRNDSLKYEKREVISLSLFKASVFYSLVKRLSLLIVDRKARLLLRCRLPEYQEGSPFSRRSSFDLRVRNSILRRSFFDLDIVSYCTCNSVIVTVSCFICIHVSLQILNLALILFVVTCLVSFSRDRIHESCVMPLDTPSLVAFLDGLQYPTHSGWHLFI